MTALLIKPSPFWICGWLVAVLPHPPLPVIHHLEQGREGGGEGGREGGGSLHSPHGARLGSVPRPPLSCQMCVCVLPANFSLAAHPAPLPPPPLPASLPPSLGGMMERVLLPWTCYNCRVVTPSPYISPPIYLPTYPNPPHPLFICSFFIVFFCILLLMKKDGWCGLVLGLSRRQTVLEQGQGSCKVISFRAHISTWTTSILPTESLWQAASILSRKCHENISFEPGPMIPPLIISLWKHRTYYVHLVIRLHSCKQSTHDIDFSQK